MRFLFPVLFLAALSVAILSFSPESARAAAEVGKAAPAFTAEDINGNTVSLADYAGKNVVLEWFNHDCPYVKKHYDSGNMQATQKTAIDEGAVWLTIVSSAEGQQGYTTPEQAAELVASSGSNATTRILDTDGTIGHLYNAKTTPHMFVIDDEGLLVYAGAIDNQPNTDPATIDGAENYVLAALTALNNDTEIATDTTAPYGCSVKY